MVKKAMAKKALGTPSSSSPITRSATAPRRSPRLSDVSPTTTREPAKPKRSGTPIAKKPAEKKKTKSTSEEKPSPSVKKESTEASKVKEEAVEEKEEDAAEKKVGEGSGKEGDKGLEDKEDGSAEGEGDEGSGNEGDGAAEENTDGADDGPKTVIIEHCKQCNSFKKRAMEVKERLEKGVVGVQVVVNPEPPRRGSFVIRQEGGEVFINLLDMKRPFKNMKDLDMDEVISDIVEKIK